MIKTIKDLCEFIWYLEDKYNYENSNIHKNSFFQMDKSNFAKEDFFKMDHSKMKIYKVTLPE